MMQVNLQKNQAEIDELERQLANNRCAKDRLANSVTKISARESRSKASSTQRLARLRTIRRHIVQTSNARRSGCL